MGAMIDSAFHRMARLVSRGYDNTRITQVFVPPPSYELPVGTRPRLWRGNIGSDNGFVPYQSASMGTAGWSGLYLPTPRDLIIRARYGVATYSGGNPGSPTRYIPATFAPTSLASSPNEQGTF